VPRVRLGVALLVPPPFDAEVDGLRRALGDGALGRIPAHLTLVPPVNVREDRLAEALAVLRRAAAATRPFTATLGPPATFLPDNPTVHLAVADGGAVTALRDKVFVDPLARALTWPFVPHVTLADEADPGRIDAALTALAGYRVEVSFARVHLLREGPGRIWAPIADAPFAPPAVIGRGGLPLELTVTEDLDPEALGLARAEARARLAVTARSEGAVAGFAAGWYGGGTAHLAALVVTPEHAALGVARHLVAAFRSEAAERGCEQMTVAAAVGDGQDLT
jgi:2'-5' RNA ligase